MPASFTGDFAKLARYIRDVRKLREFPERLSKALAEETLGLVHQGFEEGRSPYGQRWKPVGRPGGQPLRDTGRLQNSVETKANRKGFRVWSRLIYAAVHNYGAIIKAKNAPMLRFRVGGVRGGKTQRAGGKLGAGERWVSKLQVKIPRRQFLPSGKGTLPFRYRRAYNLVSKRLMRLVLKETR